MANAFKYVMKNQGIAADVSYPYQAKVRLQWSSL